MDEFKVKWLHYRFKPMGLVLLAVSVGIFILYILSRNDKVELPVEMLETFTRLSIVTALSFILFSREKHADERREKFKLRCIVRGAVGPIVMYVWSIGFKLFDQDYIASVYADPVVLVGGMLAFSVINYYYYILLES